MDSNKKIASYNKHASTTWRKFSGTSIFKYCFKNWRGYLPTIPEVKGQVIIPEVLGRVVLSENELLNSVFGDVSSNFAS